MAEASGGGRLPGTQVIKGNYDAATNTPDLDTSPSGICYGWTYVVLVGGTFFTETVDVGDQLIALQNDPTQLSHWSIIQGNVNAATESALGIVELAEDGESAANVVVQGDDARLSDARTPTAHNHTESEITDLDHDDTDAIHDNVDGEIAAVAEKTTPVDADVALIEDSAASNAKKRLSWANLKATLKSYLDTLYAVLGHTHTESEITDLDHIDADAMHDNVDGEIHAITEKTTPVDADELVIEDSEASHAKKRLQIANLPGGTDTDAIHDNVDGEIAAVAEKTTPVDADVALIEDSAASNAKKRLSWANLKATLKTYTDTLYAVLGHTHTESDVTDLDHDDTDAIHGNVTSEIHSLASATPATDDDLVLEDKSAAYAKRRTTIQGLLDLVSGASIGFETGDGTLVVENGSYSDGAWTDVNCSAVCGANDAIILGWIQIHTGPVSTFIIRRNGSTQNSWTGLAQFDAPSSNSYRILFLALTDATGKFEVRFGDDLTNSVNISVLAYLRA